jgi:hypothetical protein
MVGDVQSCAEVLYKDALLASPCWKLPAYISYPHHPGGVAENGEKSHVVP